MEGIYGEGKSRKKEIGSFDKGTPNKWDRRYKPTWKARLDREINKERKKERTIALVAAVAGDGGGGGREGGGFEYWFALFKFRSVLSPGRYLERRNWTR